MRSIRRQVQHGPTCRSLFLLIVGLCIISVGLRPRSVFSRYPVREDEPELRQVLPRIKAGLDKFLPGKTGVSRDGVQGAGINLERKAVQGTADARGLRQETSLNEGATTGRGTSAQLSAGGESHGIHVILTSNGSPYMNWQSRIMYYTYQQVANLPGSDFKWFTRVLHRSTEDSMMEEMPTYRVEPLDPSCDTWCEYPVASRPNAIQQWLDSGDCKGTWVFMIETDYIFVKPLTVPDSGRALGFPFGYIAPTYPGVADVMRKYYPGRIEDIPNTGNAPVLAPTAKLREVIPFWVDLVAKIEADKPSKDVLGWVREMYGFSIATALAHMPIDLPLVPKAIMSQPPADAVVGDAAVLHYTWGSVIKDNSGAQIWEFDKRKFTDRGLPDRIPEPPPDKATVAQKLLIKKVNEAIDTLPKYTRKELEEMGKSSEEIATIFADDAARRRRAAEGGGGQGAERGIHVMATSNGNPYMNWQTQLMYHSWKKVTALPGNDMKWFTRVLHRQKEDELMGEVPTVRVEPLDPRCDVWCEYPVASRPYAIKQWLDSGDVKGDWIFMVETDYLFVKPVSIPPSGRALGFPFGYIIPTYPTIVDVMHRFYPGDLTEVPQTGNAPILAPASEVRTVVPIWVDITARIELDAEAKEKLGWVREMYAFSIAAALGKMMIDLPLVPKAIMVQPPADSVLGDAAIIHYTWGSKFENDKKEVLWEWDKRTWTQAGDRPKHIRDPPPEASELQLLMVKVLNDGIDTLRF
eukprot:TRINITY_DN27713_c0_g1_i1.p1 TRINITY_DN27713_c0_g1~~TRINITY_DN27713_c0_g1_i1.p1  ORF type:complete len:749 (+),score=107.35 TRINITY_DN27713_c0_g1_i1:292-2538(+)